VSRWHGNEHHAQAAHRLVWAARGLASIVFGIIVFNEQLPGNDTLEAVVICTVLLSVVAHGVSANPLLSAFGSRLGDPKERPAAPGHASASGA
jgi:hypothetical protein